MTIHWEENLRLGAPAIDEAHEGIFEYFNKLTDAIENGNGSGVVIDLLTYLDAYATTHFQNEESLMELYKYPGLEEQKKQHIRFRENISALTDQLTSNATTQEIAIKIDATLIRYFIMHVRKLDKEMADFVKSAQLPRI